MGIFEEKYKGFNREQKDAVDTIDGPVMVVAGPGTGKTQVLALRIGNILQKTDTKADSILCLTFTNSGVKAMRERLRAYIGAEAGKVRVATFHSFGMDIVGRHYDVLGYDKEPALLDEQGKIALADEILEAHDWEYIRPRADIARYFNDLTSLISLLKRERIAPGDFKAEIEKEIESLKNAPESVSSRGVSKGKLKKEVEAKIEGLARTLEAVRFYEIYEEKKKERGLLDYDDVLESLVRIAEESETARSEIREEFLYVLVDEHQDSSGVQNEFLQAVWGDVENPNIFVVGDDRQLIYGFGGASLEYFENFKHAFGKAKLITLVENYRSTERILDVSHSLLQSSISKEKLKSNKKENHPVRLVAAAYPRDEIISCALEVRERMERDGIEPSRMAILVPKNRQVHSTIAILKDFGIKAAGVESADFFDAPEAKALIRVLRILAHPADGVAFGQSLFDPLSGISPIEAHKFLAGRDMKNFSLLALEGEGKTTLFGEDKTSRWIGRLKDWLSEYGAGNLYSYVQKVGGEFLLTDAKDHDDLVMRVEVLRTILHLLLAQTERNPALTLAEFLAFLERIEQYGERIPLAVFGKDDGVRVLTLHGSKGLEFDFVWIAHMDEKSFMSSRRRGFALPESIKDRAETRDMEVKKRELYVAITRAERFCTISYAENSHTGAPQELAEVVLMLDEHFEKTDAAETEEKILSFDPASFVRHGRVERERVDLEKLKKLVAEDYEDRTVSVSLLNNFFECPWKWYFRSLLKLPEPPAESLEFGNVVHKAIDAILREGGVPKPTRIAELACGDKVAEKAIAEFVKISLPEIKKGYKNEQSVSVKDKKFPHLDIYGRIDLIENLSAGAVRVTDFKTGSPKKKNDIEKRDDEGRLSNLYRQLAMYAYLLQINPKWKVRVDEAVLEFLEAKKREERFYRTAVSEEETDLLVRDIEDYDRLVKSGEWTARPCNFNSYGKQNAVCEYCKMAEIYK